jgi:hypothetical protein
MADATPVDPVPVHPVPRSSRSAACLDAAWPTRRRSAASSPLHLLELVQVIAAHRQYFRVVAQVKPRPPEQVALDALDPA